MSQYYDACHDIARTTQFTTTALGGLKLCSDRKTWGRYGRGRNSQALSLGLASDGLVRVQPVPATPATIVSIYLSITRVGTRLKHQPRNVPVRSFKLLLQESMEFCEQQLEPCMRLSTRDMWEKVWVPLRGRQPLNEGARRCNGWLWLATSL